MLANPPVVSSPPFRLGSLWSRLFRRQTRSPLRPESPTRRSGGVVERDEPVTEVLLTSAIETLLGVDFSKLPAPVPLSDEAETLAQRVVAYFKKRPPALDAFPQSSMRVLQLVAEPNITYRQLGAIIGRDPAMSAEVIRVSNSAFYCGVQKIHSISDAMSRVGMQEIARIVGIIASRSLFDTRIASERSLFAAAAAQIRHQSIATAIVASGLSLELRDGQSDRAFTGGILHDIGKSLALRSLAGLVLDEGLKIDAGDPKIFEVVERVHVEVGLLAHETWKLPPCLCLMAQLHHERGADVESRLGRVDFHAVRLTSALGLFRNAPELHLQAPCEILESAHALKLTPERFRVLEAERQRAEEKAQALLGVE